MTFKMMLYICNIAIHADDTTLYSKSDQTSGLWQQLELASKLESDQRDTNETLKFLSPEVALDLYKSTMWPYMEYCCHAWAGACSCYLELFDKLQKWICRISLAASLEPLAHL